MQVENAADQNRNARLETSDPRAERRAPALPGNTSHVRAEQDFCVPLDSDLACQSTTSSAPTLIYPLTSITDRLDLAQLFPKPQSLEVELGSGDGSFLAQYAHCHPDHNFLGVERLLGRLRKLDRKGRRAGLGNLRGLRIESGYFLEYLLPPVSIFALHVYFPDPWPKRKHRKNRLINERFAVVAHRALAVNGVIYLRTDDKDYFQQMVSVFAGNSGFASAATPEKLSQVPTDFERGFQARGVATLRAAYAKL